MKTRQHITGVLKWVRKVTGASHAELDERLQSLWDGYGEVLRIHLRGAETESVVVKSVNPPRPRGKAQQDRAHLRKLKSYRVERHWYEHHARQCGPEPRVPHLFGCREEGSSWLFVLEDMDSAGFGGRRRLAQDADVHAVLRWLAQLHARFLGTVPEGLWKTGTYWHLATRPDELAAMTDHALRAAAAAIDHQLNTSPYKSIVHGDAKLENFCFAEQSSHDDSGPGVAALDFQYSGGGCGMKDVVYFLDSAWSSGECAARAPEALEYYFREFGNALTRRGNVLDAALVEADWRRLYPLAWADFYRFLDGWAPGRYHVHAYARTMIETALEMSRG